MFIEVNGLNGLRILVNTSKISRVLDLGKGCVICFRDELSDVISCVETYEQVKQKIKEATELTQGVEITGSNESFFNQPVIPNFSPIQ